uniref:CRAL-TRIO domain-containing protein n=1 Tax=Glossina palpalis gambiensis TaxID=67801 RepID=A0A1B0BRS3_9MUSC
MSKPNIRSLCDELQKVAKEELNEIEDCIGDNIEALRDWIHKQRHLRARTDDQFLVAFLRGSKYSLEKAKSKIDYFYTFKTLMPEYCCNKVIDEKWLNILRTGFYIRFPVFSNTAAPTICLSRYAKFDFKRYTITDLVKYQFIIMDWLVNNDDNVIISGYVGIIDLSDVGLSHIAHFDLNVLKKGRMFLEKGAPGRLKELHLINCPKEALTLISLTISCLNEKLPMKIHVHKTFDDLSKHIGKEHLPVEYGGTNSSIEEIIAQTEKDLLAFNDYFKEDDQYGVTEHLRLEKRISTETLLGIEGSFRKLSID